MGESGENRKTMKRILIAGIGYHNLRDLSLGPIVIEKLAKLQWPENIEVEDLSYGPIAVIQNLEDRPPYDRMILIAGVQRDRETCPEQRRRVGKIYRYRWTGQLPDPEEIQKRVGEAVTGVISLNNLLIIAEYFKALPKEVIVFEVEAEDINSGWGFSQKVASAFDRVIDLVREEALNGVEVME